MRLFEKKKDSTSEARINSMTFFYLEEYSLAYCWLGLFFSPRLWTGVIVADFFADRRWTNEKERLNIADRGGARMGVKDLRTTC